MNSDIFCPHRNIILHQKSSNMNEFTKYKKRVEKAKENYLKSKKYDAHEGNMEQINKLSKPFERGYFTLAIVGGMSAGKSTFLNAFLGKHDFLPTGSDQTTCSLTVIKYSKKQQVTIVYKDNSEKSFSVKNTKEVKDILLETVAIPQKYGNGFPVLEINDDILTGLSRDEILNKINDYEKIAKRSLSGDLEHYLDEYHDPSKFVKHVIVDVNIPELEGWRIVDTPGVCALGGIEEITRDYILGKDENGYENVDAIILVYNGAKSLQENPALTDFIRDIMQQKKEIVSKRSFLAITHSASGTFTEDTDYIKKAKQQIDDAISDERIFFVDSNIELFDKYRIETGNDFLQMIKSPEIISNWTKETQQILKSIRMDLQDQKEENPCNEDFIKEFNKISQFPLLRQALNKFIIETKELTYREIVDLIKSDLNNLVARKKELLAGVKNDLEGIQSLAQTLQSRKEDRNKALYEFTEIAHKLEDKYNKPNIQFRFRGTIEMARSFASLGSVQLIRNLAENIQQDVNNISSNLLTELSDDCSTQFRNIDWSNTFPTINFDVIVDEAAEKHTTEELENEEGFGNTLKRLFSKIVFSKKAKTWGRKLVKKHDFDGIARQCKIEIVSSIKKRVDDIDEAVRDFVVKSNQKIKETNSILDSEDQEIKANNTTREDKERNMQNLEELISVLESNINSIE